MGKVIGAIPIRGYIVGLLAVALLCPFGMSIAKPIVYNVHISDSTETVSGTITTDGTIGELFASDIASWNFTVVGPVSFSIASSEVGSGLYCGGFSTNDPSNCGIVASASELIMQDTLLFGPHSEFHTPIPPEGHIGLVRP